MKTGLSGSTLPPLGLEHSLPKGRMDDTVCHCRSHPSKAAPNNQADTDRLALGLSNSVALSTAPARTRSGSQVISVQTPRFIRRKLINFSYPSPYMVCGPRFAVAAHISMPHVSISIGNAYANISIPRSFYLSKYPYSFPNELYFTVCTHIFFLFRLILLFEIPFGTFI